MAAAPFTSFFHAEDGIRDYKVTGVQTCALPISGLVALVLLGGAGLLLYDIAAVRAGRPAMHWRRVFAERLASWRLEEVGVLAGAGAVALLGVCLLVQIGRASCREGGEGWGGGRV